jgi:hypothetical protein
MLLFGAKDQTLTIIKKSMKSLKTMDVAGKSKPSPNCSYPKRLIKFSKYLSLTIPRKIYSLGMGPLMVITLSKQDIRPSWSGNKPPTLLYLAPRALPLTYGINFGS